MRRIGIIHLNQIGDMVFALPLLKALHDQDGTAEICSIVKPNLRELIDGSAYVDRILLREGGLASQWALARVLRRMDLELLICLARSQSGLLLTSLSGARTKAGFAHFPWDLALDVKRPVEGHNSWYNNARLLRALGIPIAQDNYVGLLGIADEDPPVDLPRRYVVVSPGASARRLIKAWDEEKFADLIRRLHARYQLATVLVGGPDARVCTAEIAERAWRDAGTDRPAIVDLAGRIGLRQLVTVLRRAALFVGIDSGVMHLASAVDIPVVALFGPTDPFYVGPQNRRSAVVRVDMPCVPCYIKPTCAQYDCLRRLEVSPVMDACVRLLDDAARS